jgi:ketosteroid isomerase-like protein
MTQRPRRTYRIRSLALGASVTLVACVAPDRAADRAAILQALRATGDAHLESDPAGFVAADADTVLVIADGEVHPRTRAEHLEQVRTYLQGRIFTETSFIDPPRIEVSPDGRTATVIGHARIRGVVTSADGPRQPFAFTAAWLDIWRKDARGWHVIVHANTQRDSTP